MTGTDRMNSDSTGGTDEETKLYPIQNKTISEDEFKMF